MLSGLIWVQTVCKSYQQTRLGIKELTTTVQSLYKAMLWDPLELMVLLTTQENRVCLTIYLIEMPVNACANRVDPDQAALFRAT